MLTVHAGGQGAVRRLLTDWLFIYSCAVSEAAHTSDVAVHVATLMNARDVEHARV